MDARLQRVLLCVCVLGLFCAAGGAHAQLMDHAEAASPSATVSSNPMVSNSASTAVDRQSESDSGAASVTGRRMSRSIAVSPVARAGIESQLPTPFGATRTPTPRPVLVMAPPRVTPVQPHGDSMLVNIGGPMPSLPAYASKPKPTSKRRTTLDQTMAHPTRHVPVMSTMRSSQRDGAFDSDRPNSSPR